MQILKFKKNIKMTSLAAVLVIVILMLFNSQSTQTNDSSINILEDETGEVRENNDNVDVRQAKLSLRLPLSIREGDVATITWETANVLVGTCKLFGENGDGPWEEDSNVSGVETSTLIKPTIYYLTCYNLDKFLVAKSKIINVK